ncbi:PLP-dependent transferase [Micromonospora sp. DR5-3]|uniref:PLP-dependent transferase n=1 Tax=unclassified Micromonospora TaxID=2617518 RepID=UPI001652626E|nr:MULTISPECIES: PLP-dependent transferase [unclassified Micromonospora]MCW3819863.1 PLP-dependent transferase [Micromonospora sp. DR5-3]
MTRSIAWHDGMTGGDHGVGGSTGSVAAPSFGAGAPLGEVLPEQVKDLSSQFDGCLFQLRAARREIEEYATYCARNDLLVDEPVLAHLVAATQQVGMRVVRQQRALLAASTTDAADLLGPSEAVLRFGLATLAYVRHSLDWSAKSYGQSAQVQFFGTQSESWPTIHYDRNGTHASVIRVERQLLELLDLPPDRCGIGVTSSGMAAYTWIEAFLLRDRLRAGDTVLLAPYIYYETAQQLHALPEVRAERASGYAVEEIIADVVRLRPKVIFVDPLANNVRQRMLDLPELFRRLREVVTERCTVVVDGTMTGASLQPTLFASDDRLEVMYYESCTKYLQLGMDFALAGLVVFPIELAERMDMLRRNTGLVLARHNAELFPRYQVSLHRRRMRRIWANAERLATLLHADPRVTSAGVVHHPVLPHHPDTRLAAGLPYGSGIVTFVYHDRPRNDWDNLDAVVDQILVRARTRGTQVTKGVSFGYSVPRVWAQSVSTTEEEYKYVPVPDDEPRFLRLYVGDRMHQLDGLAKAIAEAIAG